MAGSTVIDITQIRTGLEVQAAERTGQALLSRQRYRWQVYRCMVGRWLP